MLLDASAQHAGRTGREILTLAAQAPWACHAAGSTEMLDLVASPTTRQRRRVRDYSLGMRQRLGIAHALLGDPEVLILDEPANGLDPAGIRWMRDLLRGYADRGGTVLLSSHLLHEIEVVADNLVVIGNGRIVAAGPKRGPARRSGNPGPHPPLRAAQGGAHRRTADYTVPDTGSAKDHRGSPPCQTFRVDADAEASVRSRFGPASRSSSCAVPTAPDWRRCSSSSPPTPSESPARPATLAE